MPYYVASELLAGEDYGEKVDMWSVGVILYVMLAGVPPFHEETTVENFEAVLRANLRFRARIFHGVPAEAKDLLRRLICKDVTQKLLAGQVLRALCCTRNFPVDLLSKKCSVLSGAFIGSSFIVKKKGLKKARLHDVRAASTAVDHSSNTNAHIDFETLEKEYVLVSAQYLLVLAKDKSTLAGSQTHLEDMVYTLIHENFYDMAFTVLFKFWRGFALKKELENLFVAILEKCCENRASTSFMGRNTRSCIQGYLSLLP